MPHAVMARLTRSIALKDGSSTKPSSLCGQPARLTGAGSDGRFTLALGIDSCTMVALYGALRSAVVRPRGGVYLAQVSKSVAVEDNLKTYNGMAQDVQHLAINWQYLCLKLTRRLNQLKVFNIESIFN